MGDESPTSEVKKERLKYISLQLKHLDSQSRHIELINGGFGDLTEDDKILVELQDSIVFRKAEFEKALHRAGDDEETMAYIRQRLENLKDDLRREPSNIKKYAIPHLISVFEQIVSPGEAIQGAFSRPPPDVSTRDTHHIQFGSIPQPASISAASSSSATQLVGGHVVSLSTTRIQLASLSALKDGGWIREHNPENGFAEWYMGNYYTSVIVVNAKRWANHQNMTKKDLNTRFEIYESNLKKLRGHIQVIRLEHVIPIEQIFVLQRYGLSFADMIATSDSSVFWEEHNHCRPTEFLTNTIMKGLDGLFLLADKDIDFEFLPTNLVYLVEDISYSELKFINIYSFGEGGGSCYARLCRSFEKLLKENIPCPPESLAWEDFLQGLRIGMKPEKIRNHPFMWKVLKDLGYVIDLYYLHRWKVLNLRMYDSDFLEQVCGDTDWRSVIRGSDCLADRYDYAVKTLKHSYDGSVVGLVRFIRDTFQHFHEKMEWYNEDKIIVREAEWAISWRDLEELFKQLFPNLVLYFHKYIDID